MSSTTTTMPELILFTFPESVFGRRLERYLNLRSIPHTPIRVPPNMPRPIFQEKLGISHRRIPIMSLGRDIYCDTRLILQKLESLFPDSSEHPTLGAKDSFGKGFEAMLEGWVIDAGSFWRMNGRLPQPHCPLLWDEDWVKDRYAGSGGAFSLEALKAGRTWCISQLRIFFGIMENILGDGRKWVLGNGERPRLADVYGAWVYDWGINMATDMMIAEHEAQDATGDIGQVLNEEEFPKVHAWIRRFRLICEDAAKNNAGARPCGEGREAETDVVKKILTGDLAEPLELVFETGDVLGLKQGQRVRIAPADFGFTNSDTGVLVGLSRNEVVIKVESSGAKSVKIRLHFPRINFKITPT